MNTTRDRSDDGVLPVAWVTEAGAMAFLVVALILLLTRPDYDPVRRYISEYAVGPGGWAMRVGFLSLGVASLNLVPAFFRAPLADGGRAAGWALAVWGGATLVAAAFTVDPQGAPWTVTGAVHLASAGVGFLALMAAMALAARAFRRAGRSPMAKVSGWAAVLTPVAFLLEASVFATLGWVGVGQWLLFTLAVGWIFYLGRTLT